MPPYELARNNFSFSQCIFPWCPWYVTYRDIHYIPKTLPSFGHQNKGGYIFDMNTFQWANHGVPQFVSHLFSKQVQTQTTLNQIDYNRWGCKRDNTSHTHMFFYYFCDYFLGNFLKIFLQHLWKNIFKINLKFSYYFIKFYVKNLEKFSFSKKFKSIYKSFYCLKASVTILMNVFV